MTSGRRGCHSNIPKTVLRAFSETYKHPRVLQSAAKSSIVTSNIVPSEIFVAFCLTNVEQHLAKDTISKKTTEKNLQIHQIYMQIVKSSLPQIS